MNSIIAAIVKAFGDAPVPTATAIGALLVSIGALGVSIGGYLQSRRKQRFEERSLHAEQIKAMKQAVGRSIRALENHLNRLGEAHELYIESLKEAAQVLPANYSGHSETEDIMRYVSGETEKILKGSRELYEKLGKTEPKTKDPVLLASLIVEVEGCAARAETMLANAEKLARVTDEGREKIDKEVTAARVRQQAEKSTGIPPDDVER